jgi:Tn3 transposase DDE domain
MWRRLIFAGAVPDRRLYETAVLATLRDRLRGADVWVAGSRDHRAFEDYLLPAEPAGVPAAGIGGEADPERYVAARAGLLHQRLLFVAARAGRGELDGVEIEDGTLYVARAKPTVPDAARLLANRLYGMLPRVRVTEVLSDVEQATRFAGCFTHLRTGNPAADMPALLAAVLADGTNLGLSRMADATRGPEGTPNQRLAPSGAASRSGAVMPKVTSSTRRRSRWTAAPMWKPNGSSTKPKPAGPTIGTTESRS